MTGTTLPTPKGNAVSREPHGGEGDVAAVCVHPGFGGGIGKTSRLVNLSGLEEETHLVAQLPDELLAARQHVYAVLCEAAEGPHAQRWSSNDEQVLVVCTASHLSECVLTLSPVDLISISTSSASS